MGWFGPWRREKELRHQAPAAVGEPRGAQLSLPLFPRARSQALSPPRCQSQSHRPVTRRYLEALRLWGATTRAGLAPQAPQEVAHVEKVLVDAVIEAVCLQVHLEALTWQNDGWGILVGLQDVLCGRGKDCLTSWPGGGCPPLPTLGDPGTSRLTCQGQWRGWSQARLTSPNCTLVS